MMIYKHVKRSWLERLFSLSPFQATREERDYVAEAERATTISISKALQRTMERARAAQNYRPSVADSRRLTHKAPPAPAPSSMLNDPWYPSYAAPAPSADYFRSGGGGNFGGGGASGGWDSGSSSYRAHYRLWPGAANPRRPLGQTPRLRATRKDGRDSQRPITRAGR